MPDQQLIDDMEAVCRLLAECPAGMSQEAISSRMGWSSQTTNAAMSPLVFQKVVTHAREKQSRGTRACTVYRLRIPT